MREPHLGQDLLPTWLFYARGLVLSCGAWASLLLVGFGLLALWRPQRELLLLSAFPIAYLGYMSAGRYYFLRFLLPVLPFCALAISHAAVRVASALDSPRQRTWILAALAILGGWEPIWADVALNRVLGEQDTRIEARGWVERTIASGSTVYLEAYGPQTRLSRPEGIGSRSYRIIYGKLDQPLSFYEQQGAEYFILSSFMYERYGKDPARHGVQRAFYAELRSRATLLRTFDPFREGRREEFHLDEVYAPIEPTRYARPGPFIEVFHLPRVTQVGETAPHGSGEAGADRIARGATIR
jgi:hypothetical protein